MVIATIVGAFAAVFGGLIGFVAWRDRRRQGSTEDAATTGEAELRKERFAAGRDTQQTQRWLGGQIGDGH
ncbi:hypothetical protein [Phytohabitans rumicis]|uniref:Uncharacterized protein n=1 Tax=Phytohabitans rumicis TaxID=1076125 RepID=A0A6V8LCI8_9ACTN|nr:hypothetical protein [Phytohabitans rumicis]GFJ94922.1 hypothetical protein Prum_085640 [Phytohabitans rumicis]